VRALVDSGRENVISRSTQENDDSIVYDFNHTYRFGPRHRLPSCAIRGGLLGANGPVGPQRAVELHAPALAHRRWCGSPSHPELLNTFGRQMTDANASVVRLRHGFAAQSLG